MAASEDHGFGKVAVDRGLITAAQLEAAVREQGRLDPQPALEILLVRSGRLTPEQAAEVARQVAAGLRSCPATQDAAPSTRTPGPTSHTSTFAASRLGKYELLEEVGRGGMGVVYRAFDTELRREVALKTLPPESGVDAERMERLLREARTAATLDHPGIVQIHEVAVVDGIPCFAMAYVRGRTLHEALRSGGLSGLRERAQIVHSAAEAVAHAHERRVIHRDLKPGNIQLDEHGRVHVMDFGLARRLDGATRLTVTGQVLGTPQYMAPEQIDGDREQMSPATDVYSLGAVLYEVLTGRPPFEGASALEVLGLALTKDPEPPRRRDPRIPVDLETICLKALGKEPKRRYPTAGEFARDLGRYLAGEAVEARRETWFQKGMRAARRRKGVTGLVGAMLLALLAAAWFGVRAGSMERERARLERERMASLRATSSMSVEATLMVRRAGGSMKGPETRFLPPLQDVARKVIEEAPGLAEPHHHLGRMYRALLRFPAALEEQNRALEKEPDYAPSLYERAVLRARQYADRLAALRSQWAGEQGVRLAEAGDLAKPGLGGTRVPQRPSDQELAAADGEAIALTRALQADLDRLEHLGVDRGSGGSPAADDPGALSMATLVCARGLRAAYLAREAEDRAAAKKLLHEALASDPTLEEAYTALAMLAWMEGRIDEAVAHISRGLAVDKGHVPFWIERARLRQAEGNQLHGKGVDPCGSYAAAIADCMAALELDPESTAAWRLSGEAHSDRGTYQQVCGQDPGEDYARASQDLGRVLELSPGDAGTWVGRGSLRCNWARFVVSRGESPESLYAQAMEDYQRAVTLAPHCVEAWEGRGNAYVGQGAYRRSKGGDPREQYAAAVADYDEALRRDPTHVKTWRNRANLRYNWGVYRRVCSEDARQFFVDSVSDFDAALALDPGSADTWSGRGTARGDLAAESADSSVGDQFIASIADHDRAVKLNPKSHELWGRRARTFHTRAHHASASSAEQDHAAAIASFDEAIACNPAFAENWFQRGHTQACWGRIQSSRGEDASASHAGAVRDCDEALKRNPQSAMAWVLKCELLVRSARERARKGEDPMGECSAAVVAGSRAIELEDNRAQTWCDRGEARSLWGEYLASCGKDPGELYAAAIADYDKADELKPGIAYTWMVRAATYSNWGVHRMRQGTDPSAEFAAAIADYDRLLGQPDAQLAFWADRGNVRDNWATAKSGQAGEDVLREQAIADYDRVVKRDPKNLEVLRKLGAAALELGHLLQRRGEAPDSCYAQSISAWNRALEIDPADVGAWRRRADAHLLWAYWRHSRGETGEEPWIATVRAYSEVVDRRPDIVLARKRRAEATLNRILNKSRRWEDRRDLCRDAMEDLSHSIGVEPRDPVGRLHRGLLHLWQCLWSEAVADLEAAVKLDPALEPVLAVDLAEARAGARMAGGPSPMAPWFGAMRRATEAYLAGDRAKATVAFEESFVALERALQPLSNREREQLVEDAAAKRLVGWAHLCVARNLGWQVAGGRAVSETPIAVQDADRLRDAAFGHLQEARRWWPKIANEFSATGDLDSLRQDPRWPEHAGDVPSQGR